jgi:hypothetical protein
MPGDAKLLSQVRRLNRLLTLNMKNKNDITGLGGGKILL